MSESLMVGAREAARLVGLGKSSWHKFQTTGRLPAPVRIGRRTLWSRAELGNWVSAGCPSHERWEQLKREGGAQS